MTSRLNIQQLLTTLLLATLATTTAVDAAPWARPGQATGRPLAEALKDLQEDGLKIFFTSRVVTAEMRVAKEPSANRPLDRLRQLLDPHDLTWEEGPGGRLVIVRAEKQPATVRGQVRERLSGTPLPGVRVLIPATSNGSTAHAGTAHETRTTADGRFLIPEVPAGTATLEAHLPGFVVQRLEVLTLEPRAVVEILIEMDAAPMALDEIIVTPSRMSLNQQEPVNAVDLDRDDLLALPHLGDDIFRAFTLLPGVTGEEASARFHVRGGRSDEVLVLLDRLELYAPYHLKDFSSSVSIITPKALSEVNLITGGYSAQYGDRMSGVLEMNTVLPESRRTHLGVGVIAAEVGSAGTFREQRGHWLASVRRSNLDLALDLIRADLRPEYWDGFGKADFQLRDGHGLGLNVLQSDDKLDALVLDPDTEEAYQTAYGSSYLWLTHQAMLGKKLFIDTVLSRGRVDRDRRGGEVELEEENEGEGFTISDRRGFDVTGFKQDWNWQPGERNYFKWGLDVRLLETDYDYLNTRELDGLLDVIRSQPRTGTTLFQQRLTGDQYSFYLSDRIRPGRRLTLEFGLRYDEQTLTRDNNISPRLNLVYAPGPASTLRFAWGYFHQSQRPYELQVEDGETSLVRAERTEQRVIGYERSFFTARQNPLFFRAEAYQRKITSPRTRFENFYEPVDEWPEIQADRVRISPEESRAHGVELFLRGTAGKKIAWWASYTYARTQDLLNGRWTPRRIDQPHAFSFDVNYRAGEHWNINLAWRFHSGWPTTAIFGQGEEDDEGEIEFVPNFGPLNGERLSAYHRLDLRASGEWRKKRGVLGFFLEIQNAYDRGNIAGFDVDFEFEVTDNGDIRLIPVEEIWGGLLPSFGLTWEF